MGAVAASVKEIKPAKVIIEEMVTQAVDVLRTRAAQIARL